MLIYKEQLPEDTMDVRLLELPFSMQAIRSSVSICARERCRSLCVNGM